MKFLAVLVVKKHSQEVLVWSQARKWLKTYWKVGIYESAKLNHITIPGSGKQSSQKLGWPLKNIIWKMV